MRTCKILLFALLFFCNLSANDTIPDRKYFFYPKQTSVWQGRFFLGFSFTKLPYDIVEEEVSTSPMFISGYRLNFPKKLSLDLQFNTNYIATIGTMGIQWAFLNQRLSMALGGKSSVWFGHLELDAIHLKTMGIVLTPYLKVGMDFRDFLITASFDTQFSYMKTSSEDVLLSEYYLPYSGYSAFFALEQSLWKNNWVALGVKLNYASFYYQTWLSYSALNKYLLYPEFSLCFIL